MISLEVSYLEVRKKWHSQKFLTRK